MADEQDRLVAPRETTSVWQRGTAAGAFHVLTWEDAREPAVARHPVNTFVDVNPLAKTTVLHVAKTAGGYRAYVDGCAPPTSRVGADPQVPNSGRVVYEVVAHRGLHEDPTEPTMHALSPCAVVVSVEDGMPLPERCSVRLMQQYASDFGNALLDVPVVSGDRTISPIQMDAHLADVVYTPYPTVRGRKPRVIIFDQRKVFRAEIARINTTLRRSGLAPATKDIEKDLEKTLKGTSKSVFAGILNLVTVMLSNKTLAQEAARAAAASRADADANKGFVGPIENEKNPWAWGARNVFSVMGSLITTPAERVRAWAEWDPESPEAVRDQAAADAAQSYADKYNAAAQQLGGAITQSGISLLISLPTLIGTLSGIPMAMVIGRAAESMARVAVINPLAGPQMIAFAGVAGAFQGMMLLLQQKPLPEADKVHMTLDELADSLEVLSSLTVASEADLNAALAENKFRRETVVWAWLINPAKKNISTLLAKKDNTGYFSQSTIDTNELWDPDLTNNDGITGNRGNVPRAKSCVQTSVSVVIEDESLCDGARKEFEFLCTSDDKHLLALAGQGMLRSVRRLEAAVQKLYDNLQRAVRDNMSPLAALVTGQTFKAQRLYWWDKLVYAPWIIALFRGIKRLDWGADGTLRDLGVQRLGILEQVRRNMRYKLVKQFVELDSPAQKLARAIQNALDRTVPVSIRVQGPGWVRTLPHKAKSPDLLYPSPDVLTIDALDVETQSIMVRESSPLKDAVQDIRSTFRRESMAMRHLVPDWERTNAARLIVKTAHTSNPALGSASTRYAPPPDSYSLVLQLPADILNEATYVSERHRRGMSLVADRRSRSALQALVPTLKDDEHSFMALSLFAELWTDELVAQAQTNATQVEYMRTMFHSPIASACNRAAACARLVLETTEQAGNGFFPRDDPMLIATQTGRDAARFGMRLHLDGRSGSTDMRRARSVAKALAVFGTLESKGKQRLDRLPSEPLQSLFMSFSHGLDAFVRASQLAQGAPTTHTKHRIVEAVSAGYPSLMIDLARHEVHGQPRPLLYPPRPLPTPEPAPASAAEFQELMNDLRMRMAKLRLDFGTLESLVGIAGGTRAPSTDALAAQLAKLGSVPTLTGRVDNTGMFYVPFGYGDPLPALSPYPMSAVMFGSVPVWVDTLLVTIVDLIASLSARAAAPYMAPAPPRQPHPPLGARTVVVRVGPSRNQCLAVSQGPLSAPSLPAPSILQADIVPARLRSPVAVSIVFSASTTVVDLPTAQQDAAVARVNQTPFVVPDAATAASEHVQSKESATLAVGIGALAWNTERVLQSSLLAMVQGDFAVANHPVALSVVLPDPPRPPDNVRARIRELETLRLSIEVQLVSTTRDALYYMQAVIAIVRGLVPADGDRDFRVGQGSEAGGGANDVSDRFAHLPSDLPPFLRRRIVEQTGALVCIPGLDIDDPLIVNAIANLNVPKISDDELMCLAAHVGALETRMYRKLANDPEWRDNFESELAPLASRWVQVGKAMRVELAKFLKTEPDAVIDLRDETNDALRLLRRRAEIDQKLARERLGRAARVASLDLRAERQRRMLAMSYALGTGLARGIVGPSAPRIADTVWPAGLSRKQRRAESDVMIGALQRLHATLQPSQGKVLRLSEVCAITHLVCES